MTEIIEHIAEIIDPQSEPGSRDYAFALGKSYEILKFVKARMERIIIEKGGIWNVKEIMKAFDDEHIQD